MMLIDKTGYCFIKYIRELFISAFRLVVAVTVHSPSSNQCVANVMRLFTTPLQQIAPDSIAKLAPNRSDLEPHVEQLGLGWKLSKNGASVLLLWKEGYKGLELVNSHVINHTGMVQFMVGRVTSHVTGVELVTSCYGSQTWSPKRVHTVALSS